MNKKIVIDGMMCMHCAGAVEKALNALDGVTAKVDLEQKCAHVELAAPAGRWKYRPRLQPMPVTPLYPLAEEVFAHESRSLYAVPLSKTAGIQLDGILKMIDEDRYCIDISNQVLAATPPLGKVNKEIVRAHLAGCLRISSQAAAPRKWRQSWTRSCPFWSRRPADRIAKHKKLSGSLELFQ